MHVFVVFVGREHVLKRELVGSRTFEIEFEDAGIVRGKSGDEAVEISVSGLPVVRGDGIGVVGPDRRRHVAAAQDDAGVEIEELRAAREGSGGVVRARKLNVADRRGARARAENLRDQVIRAHGVEILRAEGAARVRVRMRYFPALCGRFGELRRARGKAGRGGLGERERSHPIAFARSDDRARWQCLGRDQIGVLAFTTGAGFGASRRIDVDGAGNCTQQCNDGTG
jgi:hypothetical protein